MENLNIKGKLREMFTMQKDLNENILKEFGEDSMTEEKLELAIIDELGELTHECKGVWCWWKKTQPPVNRQRVLEELVDVYHFVMTWELYQKIQPHIFQVVILKEEKKQIQKMDL